MQHTIKIKNHEEINGEGIIRRLTRLDLPKIMLLQQLVTSQLMQQDIFQADEESYIERHLGDRGITLGCFAGEALIAYGIAAFPGYEEDNLGYDIGIAEKDMPAVAHLESVVVHPEYRGNNLQYILCSLLEKEVKALGFICICATVSPYNKYSLKNLERLGLSIKMEKLKYHGKLRYILYKTLK